MIQKGPYEGLSSTQKKKISIVGYLEKITFQNPANYYTVARLRAENTGASITVVGHFPEARAGETVKLTGQWKTHVRFGEQFNADLFEVILPQTIDGIHQYLGNGMIKGIGPKTVSRILDRFGQDALTIIEKDPHQLTQIKGIGLKTAQQIAHAWQEQHRVRTVMRFLQDYSLPPAYCSRLINLYGEKAIDILKRNPFQIALDWPRNGFKIADAIAVARGLPRDDPDRAKACLIHQATMDAGDGHTLSEKKKLIDRCRTLFDISKETLDEALVESCNDGHLVTDTDVLPGDNDAIYIKRIHRAETGIIQKLVALLAVPVLPVDIDRQWMAEKIVKRLAISLSDEQRKLLEAILSHRVAILTGGPGTGKTTLIRSLVAVLSALQHESVLTAPTGRAAKKLSEVCGQPATTIHRLLRYNVATGMFDKNRDAPLEADMVIVDEASMVDTPLMHHLLDAVHMHAAILFVGDIYQLPPVGPGTVLADMIKTDVVPTFELTQIFRQAEKSPIITTAHDIRMGKLPELKPSDKFMGPKDFYFFELENQVSAVAAIGQLCTEKIPDIYGLDPIEDIQVITPMHKGDIGTINLNQHLQNRLNPKRPYVNNTSGIFREGDKVMHLKNNYAKDVYNGDIGKIMKTDPSTNRLVVEYDDRQVTYEDNEWQELTLAYAITVHKAQGSEYPAVILPMFTQHYPLLQRNLLYTAITRGKRLVIIIGTTRAVEIALANNTPRKRLSGLAYRLKRLANDVTIVDI